MTAATLQSEIEALFAAAQNADREHVRALFEQLRSALSQGAVRAALVRTGMYCPARRPLASFASAAPDT